MVFEAYNVPLIDKQGEEPKSYDYFEETFLTMCQLRGIDGAWWLGKRENRRRDDEDEAPVENVQNEEVGVEEPADEVLAVPAFPSSPSDSSNVQQKQNAAGVDPSAPTGSLPDSNFLKLQAELDHAHTTRLQAELDQARTENSRLLALL
ncbi:hypothetical protein Dimus_020417 [Dionaea muscipula]